MKLSEIKIKKVLDDKGLLGFCSFVLNDLKINNVAIHSKLDGSGIRLLFPKTNGIQCVYPVSKELGGFITKAIEKVFKDEAVSSYEYRK